MRALLTILLFVLSLTGFAAQHFDKGIRAYEEKMYDSSVVYFCASLEETPNDVSAYYNLGLAYYKSKQYGNAIWSFEKVLKLAPDDQEARDKIIIAYTALEKPTAWTPVLNRLESALYSVSGTTWSVICIVLSLIIAMVIVSFVRIRQVSSRKLSLFIGIFAFLLLIGSIYFAAGSSEYAERTTHGVIIKKETTAYEQPDVASSVKFFEGDRLELADVSDSTYAKVVSPSGDDYLIMRSDIAFI